MDSKLLTIRSVDNLGAFFANISTALEKFCYDIPTADFNYGNRVAGKRYNEDNPTTFSGMMPFF